MRYGSIRNIAIVAHVDHGKTTLVDGMLRQSGASADRARTAQLLTATLALELARAGALSEEIRCPAPAAVPAGARSIAAHRRTATRWPEKPRKPFMSRENCLSLGDSPNILDIPDDTPVLLVGSSARSGDWIGCTS